MTAESTGRKSNTGMDETGATHILLDPTSPVDARVLYVAGFGRGVYKSSDGGRTLGAEESMGSRKNSRSRGGWREARMGRSTSVIARRSEDGSIGNAGDGALYRSTDGAEHWQPVSLPEGTNGPNGLAIDPGVARSSLPRRLGSSDRRTRRRRRDISLGEWRQKLEAGARQGSPHLRRHH